MQIVVKRWNACPEKPEKSGFYLTLYKGMIVMLYYDTVMGWYDDDTLRQMAPTPQFWTYEEMKEVVQS